MNKKEKELEKLFEKDREEIGIRITEKFVKENKRSPNNREMLVIINKAGKRVVDLWKKYPENFRWVKKK